MPEKRRKTENATNPAQHQRGEKLFLRRIGCQKKILTWRCHLRLKCLYSRTHMGNVGQGDLNDLGLKTFEGGCFYPKTVKNMIGYLGGLKLWNQKMTGRKGLCPKKDQSEGILYLMLSTRAYMTAEHLIEKSPQSFSEETVTAATEKPLGGNYQWQMLKFRKRLRVIGVR